MRTSIPCTLCALALTALFPACYSTSPVYDSTTSGPAETTEYGGPSWETSVNWFGWGLVLAATGGGAYAGYESGIELEWSTGEPAREEPAANAALAGASAGLSMMILNALFKPETPVYRADDASGWLAALDERMVLVETGTRRVTVVGSYSYNRSERDVPTILALDRSAERTLLPDDTTELKIFLTAFPTSGRRDSVGLHAVATFNRDHLPFIVAKYGEAPPAQEAKHRYAAEAPSLSEAIRVAERYPEVGDVAEERGVEFVRNHRDAITFIRKFPGSTRFNDIVTRLLPTLRPAEIEILLPHITDSTTRYRVGVVLLDSATSVQRVIELTRQFPDLQTAGESHAAQIARTAGDYRLFLATYPESPHAGEVRTALLQKLKTPENLGTGVNTYYSELAPVISPDGNTLYFVRRDDPDNMGWLDRDDILQSTRTRLDTWGEAIRLPSPINDDEVNSIATITPDNNLMLLFGGYGNDDAPVSLAYRTAEGWSDPAGQEIENFYNRNRFTGYCLSPSASVIVLSIEQSDSHGDLDLYITHRVSNNLWSRPKNMGRVLNGPGSDFAPFIAGDNRTLYYSTERNGGQGDADIWMTRRLDDSWTKWTEPVNLGTPINGPDWDAYFTVPASGDYAYLVSGRSGEGESDIFRVALPDDRRPLPVVLVSGIVRDRSTNEPIEAEIIYENLATGVEVGRARTDPASGEYNIALPPGERYGFRAEGEGFLSISDNLDLSDLQAYREQTRDLEVVPLRAGETVRLNNLFFDLGGTTLHPDSYPELRRLATTMKQRSSMTIEIIGHTDSIGTAENNLALSRARATAVSRELLTLGVPASRISILGRGEEEPVAPNGTEEGRARNRRVDVRIMGE